MQRMTHVTQGWGGRAPAAPAPLGAPQLQLAAAGVAAEQPLSVAARLPVALADLAQLGQHDAPAARSRQLSILDTHVETSAIRGTATSHVVHHKGWLCSWRVDLKIS